MIKLVLLCQSMALDFKQVAIMFLFVLDCSFDQIDYSLSHFVKNEDAYHMMPLLAYSTIAVNNFMHWIGVKHFTALIEDVVEFLGSPFVMLSHSVSMHVFYVC